LFRRGLNDCEEALRLDPTLVLVEEYADSLRLGLKAGEPAGKQSWWPYPRYEYQLDDPIMVPTH
jgi:hypothetical protein